MVKIFSSIISPEKKDTQAVIEQRIRSLAVYDNEALPFLLQIRQHFSSLSDSSLGEKDLSAMAEKEDRKNATNKANIATTTIKTIIRYSQLNVPNQYIEGKSKKDYLNLRNKEYKNYNLENSTFTNVNFYNSMFKFFHPIAIKLLPSPSRTIL
ncbi:hypothetical protein BJAS_P2219 [Bathymodiolus japonicus methanotrophic gill symbiont]|uniref:hypothetical protein n=1 Tax=Bathymodiolus japonicus methanotrophic gill symbiont TaxID=113269 RepID=UPI001B6CF00F|nr:hypothetical protein [Bathymodiolus japonicus methanotrophic gill symbiont]GFO72192.1 hypothetical protein BJAS_P2219 [Bathymodiolus japonicus methanotrophic gill symbiont]